MGRGPEETLLQRERTDGQYEKMRSVTNHHEKGTSFPLEQSVEEIFC